jgi:hypothetical protein
MSTATQEGSFLRSSPDYDERATTRRFNFRATTEIVSKEEEPSIRYTPISRSTNISPPKPKSRVRRRMTGFLSEMQGKNARVTFVVNGETFQYDMPADTLTKSRIEIVNQPFEMDEIEMETDEGFVIGYRFRPLAKASDSYRETLNLDEERKRKRDLILQRFAKAKA